MSAWDLVAQALSETADQGARPTIWWRDDDAVAWTPALQALMACRGRWDVPLSLAIVPANLVASLPERLAVQPNVDALVHGFAHKNHAPATERKCEFGPNRPEVEMLEELQEGLTRLTTAWPGTLPILTPPWNRIASRVIPKLPSLGYRGLSTWDDRNPALDATGLKQINTHLDLIQWDSAPKTKDAHVVAAEMAALLRKRCANNNDEPIGLLTHHMVMDTDAFANLEGLFGCLRAHPSVHWLAARDIVAPRGRGG